MSKSFTKQQWNKLFKDMKNFNLPTFKKMMSDMYLNGGKEGYIKGYEEGLNASNDVITKSLKIALHEEFGVGRKRFDKFKLRLGELLLNNASLVNGAVPTMVNTKENKVEINKQSVILSDDDLMNHEVVICVAKFINQMIINGGSSPANKGSVTMLRDSLDSLVSYAQEVESTMTADQLDKVHNPINEKALYLVNATELEEEIERLSA